MNLRSFVVFTIILSLIAIPTAKAQTDSVIGQVTSAATDSFAGSISGDGRLVAFESKGNIATVNPRNTDGNTEIFLWDYAQRRIFQITDTKSVQNNTFGDFSQANTRIEIANKRPVITQNGLWVAFASNATAAIVSPADGQGPGSFDGNSYNTQNALPTSGCPSSTPLPTPTATPTATPTPTGTPSATPTPVSTPFNNPLVCDGNMEIFLYQVPALAPADLTSGDPVAVTDLAAGSFTKLTNTAPSRYPQPGSSLRAPFIADDNHDASIDDDGDTIAFASTRDLVTGGNSFPTDDNDEIFVWSSGTISQITRTLRGPVQNPIYNKNPTISGDGSRVAFASTGDDPIDDPSNTANFDTGSNPADSRNEEIFYADLVGGLPVATSKQITTTTPTTAGLPVNFFEYGKRISRNGNLIAFDSFADLATPAENNGTNYDSFATYVYDVTANTARRIGARSTADSAASGGDVARYPGFTDYPAGCAGAACIPTTLVLETRMNILPSGVVATTAADGLNNDASRPVQFYKYPLNVAPATATFDRITKFPISNTFLAQSQPLTSDTSARFAFNLGLTELGGGNSDLLSEVYYLYIPAAGGTSTTDPALTFVTGASALAITPTGSPAASPTPTPTPSPTPTGSPVTPASVSGISPGMLARINFATPLSGVTPRTAVGNLNDSPWLPISLSGITMTIGGFTVGLRSVDNNFIDFVVPRALPNALTGTNYPVVINNNGNVVKGWVTIVPSRPDIFSTVVGPGGRAQAVNVVNRVFTPEPFTVTTVQVRGGKRVPTVLRLRITGVEGTDAANFNIRIGSQTIVGSAVKTGGILIEPGVYYVDFELPSALNGAGDQPIIVNIVAGSTTFSSRLDDTAPRLRIL